MIIRKTILTIMAVFAMVLGVSNASAARAQDLVKFSYTTDRGAAQEAGVSARAWDSGSIVDIVKGSCTSGNKCIHVERIEGYTLCGTDRIACVWWQGDGSCLVQIRNLAYQLGDAYKAYPKALIAHEMGHCLGLPHSDIETEIMCFCMGPSSWITDGDLAKLNAIWRDYALAA